MSYNHNLIFDFISKRLRDNPATSIQYLATELGVAYRTIEKVVFAETGKSFRTLREEVLLTKVKQVFISQPGLAIKEVSFALGFRSPRAFGRAVQRVCGLSPEELRASIASQRDLQKKIVVETAKLVSL
jgi:transcriptional regulator GlxA family with amidase domain